jgi:hypothetical protein
VPNRGAAKTYANALMIPSQIPTGYADELAARGFPVAPCSPIIHKSNPAPEFARRPGQIRSLWLQLCGRSASSASPRMETARAIE